MELPHLTMTSARSLLRFDWKHENASRCVATRLTPPHTLHLHLASTLHSTLLFLFYQSVLGAFLVFSEEDIKAAACCLSTLDNHELLSLPQHGGQRKDHSFSTHTATTRRTMSTHNPFVPTDCSTFDCDSGSEQYDLLDFNTIDPSL
jgi:hypothetical protein